MLMTKKQYTEALSSDEGGDKLLSAKASVNLVEAIVQNSGYIQIQRKVENELKHKTIWHRIQGLPDAYDKVFAFFSLAQFMLTQFGIKIGICVSRNVCS